ncbi:hypothetical protein CU098_000253, partial [Rhizopus stolonifer]
MASIGIRRPNSPLASSHIMPSHNPIQLAAISNFKLAQLTFAPPDLHSLRKTAVIKNMLEDVYISTPVEWLQQMTRWQFFTPESLEEMTQEGLEEIFAQYAQTIEAFRPVKSIPVYHYEEDVFGDEDDSQGGDDLWIAEEEQPVSQSKTNSIDSTTSSIFSQPNMTLSTESIAETPMRAPSPLSEKPLPANPASSNDDTAKQARRKSGFGGNKNRLSWTSDTGITSSAVSQNLANEIMSLFDMDFAVDIKVDTAPKLPELPFRPRRRSQQRQSQDMLTSLIPAFDKIALENSSEKLDYDYQRNNAPRVKPNLMVKTVPQRSSSLRHRQQIKEAATQPPPIPPPTIPDTPVEKTLSKKKSILRLITGKKSSHQKDIHHGLEAQSDTSIASNNNTAIVNTSRKTSTSTINSIASTSSSWSCVSDANNETPKRPQKPLPDPPLSPDMPTMKSDANSKKHTRHQHRSTKKKRKSVMEKTMSKRKSTNGLQSISNNTPQEKGLSRSKSAFIKIGNLKNKNKKQIRRTSSAKVLTQQTYIDEPSKLETHFQYHTCSEVNQMYAESSGEISPTPSQSFVKRMASFSWRMKSRNKT